MFRWFREHALIGRKLTIAFSTQGLLLAVAAGTGLAAANGLLPVVAASIVAALTLPLSAALCIRTIAHPYATIIARTEALAANETAPAASPGRCTGSATTW